MGKHKSKQAQIARELTLWRRSEHLKGVNERLQTEAIRNLTLLLALLGQHGGQMEITRGTLEQTHQNIQRLGWSTKPKPDDPNTLVVTLIEGKEIQ